MDSDFQRWRTSSKPSRTRRKPPKTLESVPVRQQSKPDRTNHKLHPLIRPSLPNPSAPPSRPTPLSPVLLKIVPAWDLLAENLRSSILNRIAFADVLTPLDQDAFARDVTAYIQTFLDEAMAIAIERLLSTLAKASDEEEKEGEEEDIWVNFMFTSFYIATALGWGQT